MEAASLSDICNAVSYTHLEIRDFCDLDRDGIGIVLIGNSEIYDRLKGRQEALFEMCIRDSCQSVPVFHS